MSIFVLIIGGRFVLASVDRIDCVSDSKVHNTATKLLIFSVTRFWKTFGINRNDKHTNVHQIHTKHWKFTLVAYKLHYTNTLWPCTVSVLQQVLVAYGPWQLWRLLQKFVHTVDLRLDIHQRSKGTSKGMTRRPDLNTGVTYATGISVETMYSPNTWGQSIRMYN